MPGRLYRYTIYRVSSPSGAFIEEPADINARNSKHAAEIHFAANPDSPEILVASATQTPGYGIQRLYANETTPRVVNPYAQSA